VVFAVIKLKHFLAFLESIVGILFREGKNFTEIIYLYLVIPIQMKTWN